jgi:H+/gluconate symporter-like permease
LTEGFGGTLKSIGIVIALGTIIGIFLERSGVTRYCFHRSKICYYILKL